MAHDALTKDELRHDPVQDWLFHGVDYAHRHRKKLIWIGSALLALIVAGLAYYANARYQTEHVAARFNEAEAVLFETNKSEADRLAKARESFKSFVAEYGDSNLAPYGWMRLGAMAAARNNSDEAEQAYRHVIDHGATTPPLRTIARTALAKLYEDRGEWERSVELYSALTGDLYGDLAEFSLARVALAGRKVDEARSRLEAVQQQYPQSSLAALARDTLYFVH